MASETPPLQLACPTCNTLIEWTEKFPARPFCSARCKLIDLGEWANETHTIAGEPVDPYLLEDELQRRDH